VSRLANLRERLASWTRSPLFWILCAAAVLRLAGIGWGLPASDGWDDDGIAPRNFLVGLAQTYASGSYFTYPPLHMFILAGLTLPGWLIALYHAHSLTPRDVIAEMIQVPYMTYFSLTARVLSAAMSLGIVYLIGKMAETIAGARAGVFAAAACVLNASFTYYSQVSNLDVPYLFWSCLALLGCMRVIAEHAPRHMRWAALSAAAAVATKDQAYALFILSVPLALAAWFALDCWPRQNWRRVVVTLLIWAAIALAALLVIDGAVFNPAGFAHRIAFLTGPASADYAEYLNNWSGRLTLLEDAWGNFPRYYPAAAVILGVMGILCLPRRGARPLFCASLLPLFAMISFTVAFNFMVLRSEPRFLLPQAIFLAVYIGIAADRIFCVTGRWPRLLGRAFVVAVAGLAFYQCAAVDAAFMLDPRYDAERWLIANVRPGDMIETYGVNAYLPRFPADAVVTRLDGRPLKSRNPLPNVTEVNQPLGSIIARRPHFVVVSGFWVKYYLTPVSLPQGRGRAIPRVVQSALGDVDARKYFTALFEGKLPYRLVHVAGYVPGFWVAARGYESLDQTTYVFERVSG
jgi:4-amino-4-deoxy-L-arabinose transferase-like glycosyltransferase